MADNHAGQFRQLRLLKAAYKTMKGLNHRWPRKLFFETVEAPYGGRITARDDAFFLRPEFTIPMFEDFIDSIKQDWQAMSVGTRDVVWTHLNCMLACSQACGPMPITAATGETGEWEDNDDGDGNE
jgi:hypothetical protein